MPPEPTEVGAATTTPAPVATVADTTKAPPAEPADTSLRLTMEEWRDFRKEMRAAIKTKPETPPEKPKPEHAASPDSDLANRLASLERENALIRTYADLGIKPGPMRDAVEKAARYVPATELRGFVEELVKAAGPAPAPSSPSPTPAAAPVAAGPPQHSDGGPPAAAAPRATPTSLIGINPEVFKAMPKEERLRLFKQSTANSNPWQREARK